LDGAICPAETEEEAVETAGGGGVGGDGDGDGGVGDGGRGEGEGEGEGGGGDMSGVPGGGDGGGGDGDGDGGGGGLVHEPANETGTTPESCASAMVCEGRMCGEWSESVTPTEEPTVPDQAISPTTTGLEPGTVEAAGSENEDVADSPSIEATTTRS